MLLSLAGAGATCIHERRQTADSRADGVSEVYRSLSGRCYLYRLQVLLVIDKNLETGPLRSTHGNPCGNLSSAHHDPVIQMPNAKVVVRIDALEGYIACVPKLLQ
jgi:hypothetical protein